jgi:hypothetical protein
LSAQAGNNQKNGENKRETAENSVHDDRSPFSVELGALRISLQTVRKKQLSRYWFYDAQKYSKAEIVGEGHGRVKAKTAKEPLEISA